MAKNKKQEYQCGVVHEIVQIRLCKKPSAGLRSKGEFFVQCDQSECQYVDRNTLPCPLHLSLFREEIREREEKARQHRETADRY
jgi:hypothetical protein